ncbi:MAG: 50S ribosomal protein L6 [Candidatus Moranbacteria bacterium]|nr:50S ribosomal protein L6 [Candidatus Moranbacteria bacterium]NTW75649.1 50S ribosomal protein L6 [Candidatus Moranbacteria bacterium]
MSRIGKKPVPVPKGVETSVKANIVTVKGAKGEITFAHHVDVEVLVSEESFVVNKCGESKRASAVWGTTAKILSNMIEGVTNGFQKQLELNGVGYRMAVSGKKINLALGFSHPVEVDIPVGIEAKIEGNILTVSGIDKRAVGQFAAEVRRLKPVEPYKGKGFKYVGEIVRRKEGKKSSS